MDAPLSPVIGVVGSTGGVGASSLACAVAAASGAGLLVDLDTCGGGIDVLLGIGGSPGVRWSGLQVAGGSLDPVDLARGLPRWRGVAVLAADGVAPSLDAVVAVIDAGRRLGPVVLDVGRCLCPAATAVLVQSSVIVVVTESEVRGLAAVRAVACRLAGPPLAMVTRRGSIGRVEASALTGLRVLGTLAPLGRSDGVRLPRALLKVAAGVLDGLLDE